MPISVRRWRVKNSSKKVCESAARRCGGGWHKLGCGGPDRNEPSGATWGDRGGRRLNSSPYAWLEDRDPACHLIAMIDDATSRIWGRFAAHDSTEENMRTLWGWLWFRRGRPAALYTDKNGLFVTSRPVQWQEQLSNQPARTQFGRCRN